MQGVSIWIPTGEGRLGAWLLEPASASTYGTDTDDRRTFKPSSNANASTNTNERRTFKNNATLNSSTSNGCVYVLYLHGISNHRSYSHRFKKLKQKTLKHLKKVGFLKKLFLKILFLFDQGLPLLCVGFHGLLGDNQYILNHQHLCFQASSPSSLSK